LLIPTDRCIRTLSIAQYWRQDWKRSFADIERDWKFEERLRKGQAECRTALWDPVNAVIDNVNRVESMTPEGLMGNLLWYGSSITLELCNIDEAPDWRVQRRTELKNQAIAVVVSGTLPL
jgi:fructosamine-3-kinase